MMVFLFFFLISFEKYFFHFIFFAYSMELKIRFFYQVATKCGIKEFLFYFFAAAVVWKILFSLPFAVVDLARLV